MVISEHVAQSVPMKNILLGFDVEHVVEGSYVVVAKFLGENGRQQYYASGPNIDSVISKVSKYKNSPEFEGFIYKVESPQGIPIAHSGEFNIKNW